MAQLIVKLKQREMKRVPILRITTKIGRDETNDVVIDNPGISRHHASVIYDGRGFVVRDEGSANGIYVNGNKVRHAALTNGDVISMGKFRLVFSPGAGVPAQKLMRDSMTATRATDSKRARAGADASRASPRSAATTTSATASKAAIRSPAVPAARRCSAPTATPATASRAATRRWPARSRPPRPAATATCAPTTPAIRAPAAPTPSPSPACSPLPPSPARPPPASPRDPGWSSRCHRAPSPNR